MSRLATSGLSDLTRRIARHRSTAARSSRLAMSSSISSMAADICRRTISSFVAVIQYLRIQGLRLQVMMSARWRTRQTVLPNPYAPIR